MDDQKGLSLVGLLVTIILVFLAIALIMPQIGRVKRISGRVVCGTNLKGLGTAMTVYGNDYEDRYPELPGSGPWAHDLGFPYYLEKPDFKDEQAATLRNISASLYLLVRQADVSPRSFVCPMPVQHPREIKPKDYTDFKGENPKSLDLVQLWDFGTDPYRHVSYAYHNPYGKYPADGSRSAAFAIMADMSPWFRYGNVQLPQPAGAPQIMQLADVDTFKYANTLNHEPKSKFYSEGQNVLFGDGHSSYETSSNVGVKNDNIYTFWSSEENPTDQDRQGGTAPTSRSPENDAKAKDDSFLAI